MDTFSFKKELADFRDKTAMEFRNVADYFKKELDGGLAHIHEVNRIVFMKIEKDIMDLRMNSEELRKDCIHNRTILDEQRNKLNQQQASQFFVSGKKFY